MIRSAGGIAARLVAALVVFLVSGEILARGLGMIDRLNGYNRGLFAHGPSPAVPYVLRPGVVTTYVGTSVRVNALGLRGADVADAPAPGVRRALVVGDSVVFGQGVGEDDAVSAVLARRLADAGQGAWETIDAGVPGFDTGAEVGLLDALVPRLHPDVVIVGFSLNDFDVVPTLNRLGILTHDPAATARPTLLDRSEFVTLLRWLVAYARGDLRFQIDLGDAARTPEGQARLAQAMPALEQATETLHRRFYEHASGPQWEKLRAGLAALAERTRTVPVLVAIFPESYQVGVADPDLTPQRRVLGLCRDVGLRCLDLQPAFAAAGGALFQDVQHPNARGHAVAAAAIAEALRDPLRTREPVR